MKVHQLSAHVGIADSGAGGLAAYLLEKVSAGIRANNIDGATLVAEAARRILVEEYSQQTRDIPKDRLPVVWLLLAGLDPHQTGLFGLPRIYFLDSRQDFMLHLATKGVDLSGVIWIAEYLASRFYSPSMSVSQLSRLAAFLITETATQDQRVGGQIIVAKISAEGYQEVETPEEVLKAIQTAREKFKQVF